MVVSLQYKRISSLENALSSKEDSQKKDELCIRGEYSNGSCLSSIDINSDGYEEIVYEPKGTSWYNVVYILKENSKKPGVFEPFCKSCTFTPYASSLVLRDINGDGLIEVIVPMFVDDNGQIDFRIYHLEKGNFALKEKHKLPDGTDNRDKVINELLEKYNTEKATNHPYQIVGSLTYPAEVVPHQKVCAVDIRSSNEICTQSIDDPKTGFAFSYKLDVPKGQYHVYATVDEKGWESMVGHKAYYTKAVECGIGFTKNKCNDHTKIVVYVEGKDIIEGVDPVDWWE